MWDKEVKEWWLCLVDQPCQHGAQKTASGSLGVQRWSRCPPKSGRTVVIAFTSSPAMPPHLLQVKERKISFTMIYNVHSLKFHQERCVSCLEIFNAQVGPRSDSGDEWWDVRGPHDYGKLNEAGKKLLSFLSINKVAVCNTWFQKQSIHKAT